LMNVFKCVSYEPGFGVSLISIERIENKTDKDFCRTLIVFLHQLSRSDAGGAYPLPFDFFVRVVRIEGKRGSVFAVLGFDCDGELYSIVSGTGDD